MDQEEPFINTDVFNVHDIAEIEGKNLHNSDRKILLFVCCMLRDSCLQHFFHNYICLLQTSSVVAMEIL